MIAPGSLLDKEEMKIEPETAFDDVIQDIPKTEMETTIQEETRDHEIETKIQVSFPPWNLNKHLSFHVCLFGHVCVRRLPSIPAGESQNINH